MSVVAETASDRPDLWERTLDFAEVWPDYNRHGDELNSYWPRLRTELADHQFVLYDDEADDVLARGYTIPCAWDGTPEDLGPGIDATIAAGFALAGRGGTATALSAMAAEIPARHRDRRLSVEVLRAMAGIARRDGLKHLIAPVRPNFKERYPLTPIERYVRWTRDDGQPFDPWLRVHARLGAVISTPLPESLLITGSVADWESWTEMAFPETGDYVFPHGLATVHVDRERDEGRYFEPNVWVIHSV